MDRHLEARLRRHHAIARALARLGDRALLARLDGGPARDGGGRSQVLAIGGHRVFVKRIPVTARELRDAYSTQNVFRLPTYYHYGVGSAGFGAFRELLAHVQSTSWVEEGSSEQFPLLHHHRIARAPTLRGPAPDFSDYVRFWHGSRRIGEYMAARAAAPAELLLFLEHVPHTAATWLRTRAARFPWLLSEARAALALLRRRGMLHLDAQAFNLLTDGKRVYVTDFGLAMSRDFELDDAERAFFGAHARYDEGELHYNLGAHLLRSFQGTSKAKQARMARRYGMRRDDRWQVMESLLQHVEDIATRSELPLDPAYVALTTRYRPVIALMSAFFSRMLRGSDKRVPFDHAGLDRALRQADVSARSARGGRVLRA